MIPPPIFSAVPAQIDASVAVSADASGVVGQAGFRDYAFALVATNASIWTRFSFPRSSFFFDASGRYGRALATARFPMRPDDLSLRASATYNRVTSPRTNLSFGANGMLASRLGLRADNDLEVRDPFNANRVIYGAGARASLFAVPLPLGILRFDANYNQAGAVAAPSADAVGIDSHAVVAGLTGTYQFLPRLRLGAMVRSGFTHFDHALLDANMTRGPMDVGTFSALATARWEMGGRTAAMAVLGVTAASPPPSQPAEIVFAPDTRIELQWYSRSARAVAGVSAGYRSLGPRIGFGMDYSAFVDGWLRPLSGAEHRHLFAHFVGRARLADTLLGAEKSTNSPPAFLTTTAFSLNVSLVGPVRLGLLATAGVDVEFVTARVDPIPTSGEPPPAFRALLMLGFSSVASTDPTRQLPRDPLPSADDAAAAAPRRAAPGRDADDDSHHEEREEYDE